MNLDWKKQRSDNGAVMKRWLFEEAAKKCRNQEITCQYQNLMYHQTNDDLALLGASSSHGSFLPICRPSAGFGFSLGSHDPNLPYSGFNYTMAYNSGSSMLRLDDRYNSQHFQKFSQDDHRGSTMLVDSDGKGKLSQEDFKKLYGQVLSPEQISSVTACSDADCYSDKTPFEVGALGVFSEPRSGSNMEVDKFMSLGTQENASALSSMPFRNSKLWHKDLPNYGQQAPRPEHCRLPSFPPAHVKISLGTQMHGYGIQHKKFHCEVPVERSSELPQLSLERVLSVEQKGFSNVQAPRPTDSISAQDILIAYLSFKSKLVRLERRQQEFVSHLHYTLCKGQICMCEKNRSLLSHFHGCHNTNCNLCQPVRWWCHTKKIGAGPISEPCPMKKVTSESGNSNLYVSRDPRARDYILPDMQPAPKRMKTENAAKFDNWSLFAVVLPHLKQREEGLVDVEDYMDKANKETLSSKEASATAVTWNETAENGGSMWCRKSDELLGVGQSPEGHIGSASMNEVPRSIGNHGNSLQTSKDALSLDNIKLGKDDAISHSEELGLVVEQQDMGLFMIRKEENVTFGCQSSHSENNYVFTQVGNLGKCLQTSRDALDLDNIKLGKDVVISHSEEQNMVDEQQEIDCVKTSKVKSDVTNGCQDLNSTDISVLPQLIDLESRTFNDGHDLDNINLGNNDAISHSEEIDLVDEQQEIGCVTTSKVKSTVILSSQRLNSNGISVHPQDSPIDEGEKSKLMSQAKQESIDAKYVLANPDNQCGRKLDDLRASGVSLTDFLTAEQIREHLCSLNQDINLNVGQEPHARMSADTVGSNTCQLCALDTITFTALAMCCTSCGARIKHKLTYYWTKDGTGARYCFCTICFKEARGGNISYRGLSFPKAELYKGKNTEESGESWVQCDRCEHWQHQICALYNSERDLKGKAKYICPFCRLSEIEAKGHVPITPVSGAQELPRTKLSDYIEQRLYASLQRERKQRAEFLGKNPEEVPGASDLTVRVVLSVNKQLKVKQQFLDILHGATYPSEFPYKSKVILLFQKVGGVDVCIFAMYVQEFGSECEKPNKRSVYVSYLDSVKYFRPEIKTVSGVALRTFVYHEILIGYLDYCKRLGFITCYIWSCPPLKGEDYILHCHPETQKRPNSHKLVQWYKKMLKKGKEENVVVEFTNFYDHFFVPKGDSNCKITAARLPYFDGDYWSRAIEDLVQTIEKDGGESDRQLKNQMTKRTMKSMGHYDLSADAAKDILVMQKLGHRMLTVKEEFFVVNLQFTCTKCHESILSGSCWSCNQCSKFYLCSRCLKHEKSSNLWETHSSMFGDKHQLYEIAVNEIAADTNDNDGPLENDFFDDRQTFLNFCEKNFYRFDTLRRAKHSSMMILHHLHASSSRSTEAICSICNQNVMAEWRCEICSHFRVCDACFEREGDHCHFHKLVKHLMKAVSRKWSEEMQQQVATEADSTKKSEQIQRSRVLEILDVLKHANQCPSTKHNPCSDPICLLLRNTFRHTRNCKRRAAGGCKPCNRIWNVLLLHARVCKDSNCDIPRCMDIRNHRRKLATKSNVEKR